MKIEDLQRLSQAVLQKPKKEKADAGRPFESVLNESMPGPQTGVSKVRASQGPLSPSAPIYVSSVSDSVPSETVRIEALQKIEMTLALLEQYHDELLDPTKTLKALADTVELLKREVGDLQELLSRYPIEEDLKEIINQTAIQTQVEVTRFDQGVLLS